MKIEDLGKLNGPVLLFGGPYSNLQATQALFEVVARLNIPASHQICTGDIVAYCADPVKTTALVRGSGCVVIAGNCEEQLAQNALDCGCGFEEGNACDLLSAGWYNHANAEVGDADRKWMGTLPDFATFTHHGRRYAVLHGGATAINRFIWSVSEGTVFKEEIEFLEGQVGPVDVVISGHSGIAFEKQIGRHTWINAGAIGMPANNGQPATEFAILDNGEIRFETLDYDHQAAHEAMIKAGLVQGYHQSLLTGFWPSEDTLPNVLRNGGRVQSLVSG